MKKPPAMGGFRIELRSCRHVQCTQKWFKSGLNWFKFRLVQAPNPLSPGASSVDGLHRGEEEHVADGVGVGQQHDQAIHAEAEAAGRGQDGLVRPSGAVFLLCRKGFRDSAMVFPLCWTLCSFRFSLRDIEGWVRCSEVLKSLDTAGF